MHRFIIIDKLPKEGIIGSKNIMESLQIPLLLYQLILPSKCQLYNLQVPLKNGNADPFTIQHLKIL